MTEPRLTQEDVLVRIALALERIAERVTDQILTEYQTLQFYSGRSDWPSTSPADLAAFEARHPWLKGEVPHAPDQE